MQHNDAPFNTKVEFLASSIQNCWNVLAIYSAYQVEVFLTLAGDVVELQNLFSSLWSA